MTKIFTQWGKSDMKATVKVIKDNWLSFLIVIGILIVLWSLGGTGGVEPIPVNNIVPDSGGINWFQSIPLK